MTLRRFQAIVLKLGNQLFVRHYLWLNYPNPTQLLGIQLIDPASLTLWRPKGRLADELREAGMRFEDSRGMWVVERTEDAK